MNKALDNFDFTPTIEGLRPWMDREHPNVCNVGDVRSREGFWTDRAKFSDALFGQLTDYLCLYLAEPLSDDVINALSRVPKSLNDIKENQAAVTSNPLEFLNSAAQREELMLANQWRRPNVFPLSADETLQAIQTCKQDKALALSVSILGHGITAYMNDFFDTLGRYHEDPEADISENGYKYYGGYYYSHYHLGKIENQAKDASQFMHEFLPVFAHHLDGDRDLSDKDFAQSLCELFRKKSMRSKTQYGEPQICPVSSVIGQISGAVFVENPDGTLSVSDEKRPGALFSFLYQMAQDELQRLENTAHQDQLLAVDQ